MEKTWFRAAARDLQKSVLVGSFWHWAQEPGSLPQRETGGLELRCGLKLVAVVGSRGARAAMGTSDIGEGGMLVSAADLVVCEASSAHGHAELPSQNPQGSLGAAEGVLAVSSGKDTDV